MTSEKFIELCKNSVYDYYYTNIEIIPKDLIFVVWYCKTLQNYKAILSTHYTDQRLFEITYNGDKNELYLDCYSKEKNMKVDCE